MRALSVLIVGILLSACAATGTSPSVAGSSGASASSTPAQPVTLRLGYFPNVTHATAIVGVEQGLLRTTRSGTNVKLETPDFNAGHRRRRGALLRRHRRHLHRPQPGDQRVREVEGRGDPDHRRRDVRRRLRSSSSRSINKPGRPQGQEAGDAAARQHAGRGAAGVAEGPGPQDRHRGRRRRLASRRRTTATTLEAFSPATSTAPGCPSRGRRGWSGGRRQGARRRGDPVAGRQVRDDPPHRRHRASSRRTPTSSSSCSSGHVEPPTTTSRPTPPMRRRSCQRRHLRS